MAAFLPLPATAGCGNGCEDTNLSLRPTTVANQGDPVTLRARLTRDGRPVAGATVLIRVSLKTSGNARTRSDRTVRTGPDGIAEVRIAGGLKTVGLSGDRVTGAEAHFEPHNEVNGVDYCWAHTSAAIHCASGTPCPART